MKRLALLLFVVWAGGGHCLAGGHHGCCADCGCNQGLRKVCRWVCEEVEVKVPGWDCQCEDIVIPGKSQFCIKEECDACGECCDACGCGHQCVSHLGGHWNHKKEWGAPCNCCVKTVNVLVRTEKVVKKKIYKPVIETVCENCCNHCDAGGCAAGSHLEDAPISATESRVTAPDRGLSMQRLRSESGTIGRFLSLKASRQPSAH
jgi:hypothetical protein